jgi:hypothetical protein
VLVRLAEAQIKTDECFRETDRRSRRADERFRNLDERVDKRRAWAEVNAWN